MDRTDERHESLWLLTVAPGIWAGHFLLSYVTAAVWCARFAGLDGPLAGVRGAIGGLTVVAVAGILLVGWRGFRQHRHGEGAVPHDFDSQADRHRFLGFATLLLAGLSGVATLYVALATVFFQTCR